MIAENIFDSLDDQSLPNYQLVGVWVKILTKKQNLTLKDKEKRSREAYALSRLKIYVPVWILWWAFRWELLVYTLVQPGWSQKWILRFSKSGLFRRLYLTLIVASSLLLASAIVEIFWLFCFLLLKLPLFRCFGGPPPEIRCWPEPVTAEWPEVMTSPLG